MHGGDIVARWTIEGPRFGALAAGGRDWRLLGLVDRWHGELPQLPDVDRSSLRDWIERQRCVFGGALTGPDGHELFLSPFASFALYVQASEGMLAMSDSPQALAPGQIDDEALIAQFDLSVFAAQAPSLYRGLAQVPAGHWLDPRSGVARPFHKPSPKTPSGPGARARAAGRLKDALARAIDTAIERSTGAIACQLSAGRDSSAILALAAQSPRRKGRPLIAITAAPEAGSTPTAEWHLVDESGIAAQTAARVGAEHVVTRPRPMPLAERLDRAHRASGLPIHQPLSLLWSDATYRAAAAQGASLLMVGDHGNFALSAGGPAYQGDLLRERGVARWAWQALRAGWRRPAEWRGLIGQAWGPRMPIWLFQALRRARPSDVTHIAYPYFRHRLRARLEAQSAARIDPRPMAGYRDWVRRGLDQLGPFHPYARDLYGVELYCPAIDRALIGEVMSWPVDWLAGPSDEREIYDLAFGDLLPPTVLRPVRRGRQNVDWHAALDWAELDDAFNRYERSPRVRQWVDVGAMRDALAARPAGRLAMGNAHERWLNHFFPALGLASFLYTRDS